MIAYFMAVVPSWHKRFQGLYFFACNHIYVNIETNSPPKYIRICDESAMKLLKQTAKMVTIEVISMLVFAMFPAFAFFLYHDIQFPFPVILPFTDIHSTNGIIINCVNQMFIGFVGSLGNIGIEICTCILNNAVWAITIAIEHSIDEFDRTIRNCQQTSKQVFHHQFRNILIQIQDYDR